MQPPHRASRHYTTPVCWINSRALLWAAVEYVSRSANRFPPRVNTYKSPEQTTFQAQKPTYMLFRCPRKTFQVLKLFQKTPKKNHHHRTDKKALSSQLLSVLIYVSSWPYARPAAHTSTRALTVFKVAEQTLYSSKKSLALQKQTNCSTLSSVIKQCTLVYRTFQTSYCGTLCLL